MISDPIAGQGQGYTPAPGRDWVDKAGIDL